MKNCDCVKEDNKSNYLKRSLGCQLWCWITIQSIDIKCYDFHHIACRYWKHSWSSWNYSLKLLDIPIGIECFDFIIVSCWHWKRPWGCWQDQMTPAKFASWQLASCCSLSEQRGGVPWMKEQKFFFLSGLLLNIPRPFFTPISSSFFQISNWRPSLGRPSWSATRSWRRPSSTNRRS